VDIAVNSSIGFVILSHSEVELLERLIGALNRTYDQPPISIHHDFSQSDVDVSRLRGNVVLVRPSYRTEWAHVSVIRAALAALRALYDEYAPEWFTLLSGTDYPLIPGHKVLKELREGMFDLYLDYQLAERNPNPLNVACESRIGSDQQSWRHMAFERYVKKSIFYPSLSKRLQPIHRELEIRNQFVLRTFGLIPYSQAWRCYAGDHWFTGTHRVADILLSETAVSRRTLDHLGDRFCPEESYYHTILGNRTDIRICKDNKRYSNWSGQLKHPRVLEINDLESMLASRCHFARKFTCKRPSQILDELDRIIGAQ
jgi:Core-2/I-Branching enzyme